MSPYDKARAVYAGEENGRSFSEDLTLHLRYGFVYSTPSLFIFGRPVRKDAPGLLIFDPRVRFQVVDCWWVWLACGSLESLVEIIPFYLPWIGYQRKNMCRYWKTENLIRKIKL